jgi:hypothetical protein
MCARTGFTRHHPSRPTQCTSPAPLSTHTTTRTHAAHVAPPPLLTPRPTQLTLPVPHPACHACPACPACLATRAEGRHASAVGLRVPCPRQVRLGHGLRVGPRVGVPSHWRRGLVRPPARQCPSAVGVDVRACNLPPPHPTQWSLLPLLRPAVWLLFTRGPRLGWMPLPPTPSTGGTASSPCQK